MKNKPIAEGYTVLAVCDSKNGYTLQMRPKGLVKSEKKVQTCIHGTPFSHLNDSEKVYFRMIHASIDAFHSHSSYYEVYMDNYFTSVNLLSALRKCNIGAAGTTRTNKSKWPSSLMVAKNHQLPYLFKSGVVVDDVLCCIWIDNNVVHFLSTVHDFEGQRIKERKRPRKTSTNASIVRDYFGDEVVKDIPIPEWIDDYNMYMGGVDLSDMKRRFHAKHLRCFRNWMPMFFFCLQNSIVCSQVIYDMKKNVKSPPGDYRMSLVMQLLSQRNSQRN
jgi:hypothetical protein